MAMPGLNDLLEIPAQAPTKGTIEILKLTSLITNKHMHTHTLVHSHMLSHTYVAFPRVSLYSYTCEDENAWTNSTLLDAGKTDISLTVNFRN